MRKNRDIQGAAWSILTLDVVAAFAPANAEVQITCLAQARLQVGPHLAAKIDMFDFSMPNLIAGFIFGSIGFVAFFYGRRMNLWKLMFCGLGLMIYPYFVDNVVLLFGIGGLGTGALFFLRD